jgi:hypothetical protein
MNKHVIISNSRKEIITNHYYWIQSVQKKGSKLALVNS